MNVSLIARSFQFRHAVAISMCLLFGVPSCFSSSTSVPLNGAIPQAVRLVMVQRAENSGWSEYRLDGGARTVTVYFAHDSQPKPVVVLLQGSGCAPLFTVEPDNTYHSTSIFQDVVVAELNRVHFVMVDKQGVKPLRFSPAMTHEQKVQSFERAERECTAEYLKNVTKNVRVEDVLMVIQAVAAEPWSRQIIVAGHSEGTHVATGVLRQKQSTEIAAAGLFASAGPMPFWAGYAASAVGNREAFQTVLDRVRMLQKADDDFMYEGLPARRWKTFWLESTPLDDVRDSNVPLFVAHGTRDGTILAPDLFVLEAVRQQPSRAIRYLVLEGGDHAFETPNGKSWISELFADFLRWALDPNRTTGTAVLK